MATFHIYSTIRIRRKILCKYSENFCATANNENNINIFVRLVITLKCLCLLLAVSSHHTTAAMPSIRSTHHKDEQNNKKMIEDDALNWRYVYPHLWHVVVQATTNNYHSMFVTIKRREQENMNIAKTKE